MNAVYHEYDENPVRKTLKQRKKKKLKRKSQNLISIMSFDHTCILFNK